MGIVRKAFSGLGRIISEESWKIPVAGAGIFAAVVHPFACHYYNGHAPAEYLIVPALVGLAAGVASELLLNRYYPRQQNQVIKMPDRDSCVA